MSARDDLQQRRWGFGEVGLGILASLLLSTTIVVVIIDLAGWRNDASDGTTGTEIPMWGQGLLQIPLWAGYLGAVWLAGRKGNGIVEDFRVRCRPLDVPIGLVVGVVTQLVVLPLIYLPIFELTGTDAEELSRPAEELASRAGGPVGWLLFALLVGLGAPIVEELFYRGLVLGAAEKRGTGRWAAVGLSALIFAGMHFQALQFPGLLVFGLVAGALVVLTGRLGPAIFAHIGFNVATVVVLYLGR
ncbi:MAG: CPBP family intramembrane glutamic endopeptidase [Microthrixaceae bacterium]